MFLHNGFLIKSLNNTNFSGDYIQPHSLDVKSKVREEVNFFFNFTTVHIVLGIHAQVLFCFRKYLITWWSSEEAYYYSTISPIM